MPGQTGGCMCGSVRYQLGAEPFDCGWCHCRTCQLFSGAPAMPFASVEAGDFLLSGTEWSRIEELQNCRKRQDREEITVFKSLGLGVEDVAAAGWVFERAKAAGEGENLPILAYS